MNGVEGDCSPILIAGCSDILRRICIVVVTEAADIGTQKQRVIVLLICNWMHPNCEFGVDNIIGLDIINP